MCRGSGQSSWWSLHNFWARMVNLVSSQLMVRRRGFIFFNKLNTGTSRASMIAVTITEDIMLMPKAGRRSRLRAPHSLSLVPKGIAAFISRTGVAAMKKVARVGLLPNIVAKKFSINSIGSF